MPRSRRANNCGYAHTMSRIASEIASVTDIDTIIGAYHCDRYHKVNMLSYGRLHTVEIRHHGGSCDPNKITNWVKFCVNFVDQSKENPANDTAFTGLDDNTISFFNERITHFSEEVTRDAGREERLVVARELRRRMREERNTDEGRQLWRDLHQQTIDAREEITNLLAVTTPAYRDIQRIATRMFYLQPTRGTRSLAQQIRDRIATMSTPRNRQRSEDTTALNSAFDELLAKQLEVINPPAEEQATSSEQVSTPIDIELDTDSFSDEQEAA